VAHKDRQEEKIDAREPQQQQRASDGQKEPEFGRFVKPGAIVDGFDHVRTAIGDLHDIAGVAIELNLPVILGPDLDHPARGAHVEAVDILPRFDPSFLSAEGVALAREIGNHIGPFDLVLTNYSLRTLETALAGGSRLLSAIRIQSTPAPRTTSHFTNSSSISDLKSASLKRANCLPLTKNVGVLATPRLCPSFLSLSNFAA
jgi:hypothetical protein